MRAAAVIVVATSCLIMPLVAQEQKPVPKDSVRVSIPGCMKGYIFTASRRTPDEPGSVDMPEGTHLRVNGPKKLVAAVKAHEGSRVEITGLIKRGQLRPEGVNIGGGVRIAPGPAPNSGGPPTSIAQQIVIDLEGWRAVPGGCPSR